MPASSNKYSPTTWGVEPLEDLKVPSGQLCQVRRPGIQGLVKAGVLDKMDTLSVLVNQQIDKGKGKDVPSIEDETQRLFDDPAKLLDMMNTVDAIVCHVVVQPEILPDPEDGEMKEGVIYAGMVDLEDKMFILNFAMGGTRDVETFRVESEASLAGLGPEQVRKVSPKRPARSKR